MTEALRLDDSVNAALKDVQTVTASGSSITPMIDGVQTFAPVNHVDHRGRVFEVYPGPSDFWRKPVVYCYAWSVRSMMTKGWGLHIEKEDRYTLIQGEALTVLFDARLDSPTHGLVQKIPLSAQGTRQLFIPRGVWHLTLNLSDAEVFLINHPTTVYNHVNPDRLLLPWDSTAIPFDLGSLFPVQSRSSLHGNCE